MDCMILVQALIAFVVLGHDAVPLISLIVAAVVRAFMHACMLACLDDDMRA